ncbi:hypothetical protein Cadr_000028499 [Camelus dromedarius]|uniref:Uncharacterized protein n=1 Tax=Camelus dromedarius TaxID=9838 RepID=A0A5N4CHV8_CAMDR|nr:hypothetical protein Cadr_000028499 [Camelus dromedarius]
MVTIVEVYKCPDQCAEDLLRAKRRDARSLGFWQVQWNRMMNGMAAEQEGRAGEMRARGSRAQGLGVGGEAGWPEIWGYRRSHQKCRCSRQKEQRLTLRFPAC